MSRRREVLCWTLLALLFAWPLALSAEEETQQPRPAALAQLEIGPNRIEWLPQVDDESLVLTVAGPGDFYLQREFGSGEIPFLSFQDGRDGSLPEGIYAYEVRAVRRPNPGLREKARELGDDSAVNRLYRAGSLPEEPLVQSGHLWVQGGKFIGKIPIPPDVSRRGKPEAEPPSRNPATKDIVQADDLIVQGQACIGSECVNGDADSGPILTLKELFGGQIRFQAMNCCVPYARVWALQANDPQAGNGDFLIRDLTSARIPFRIGASAPDNAFTIFFNGNVGLGTLTPAAALDVSRSTGALATLARLSNNGGIQLLYDRTDAGSNDWQTSNFSSTFQISIPGSATAQFSLASNGNLTISGTLTQGSSRDLKTDLRFLDPKEVLARVSSLSVPLWSYKSETEVRHVGPMAEDFHSLFGLGADEKHIAPGDQAGVALLAVQGLNQVLQEKDGEITALQDENRFLAGRIAALETMVSALLNGTGKGADGGPPKR